MKALSRSAVRIEQKGNHCLFDYNVPKYVVSGNIMRILMLV